MDFEAVFLGRMYIERLASGVEYDGQWLREKGRGH
jgi:hypothetical protein